MEILQELRACKVFTEFSREQDELEHSLEMHLPMIKYTFRGQDDIKIVPIVVGSLSFEQEREYGKVLKEYYQRDDCLFVVSSDFCHWGADFDYMPYENLKAIEKQDNNTVAL